jgi:hypothetical protein
MHTVAAMTCRCSSLRSVVRQAPPCASLDTSPARANRAGGTPEPERIGDFQVDDQFNGWD